MCVFRALRGSRRIPLLFPQSLLLLCFFSAVTASVFIDNNAASAGAGADEFVAWLQEHHANMISYVEEKSVNGFVKSDVYSFLIDKSFMIDFIKCVHEFLSTKGEFTSDGYTYTPVSETSNLTVDQWKSKYLDYVEYYFPGHSSEAESFFRSFQSMGIYGESYPYKMFYYYVTPSDYSGWPGANVRISGMACSADGFHDYPWEYRSQCWTRLNGSSLNLTNNGISSGSDYELLSAVYVNNEAASSVSTDPVTVGLTPDGQDLASDPDDYAEKVSSGLADTVVTHNSNGSVSVDDNIAFNIGVIEEVDEDGNVTYTPVIPDSASEAGFTLDDILSKPSEVEKYPTSVDDTSAQAISGTVSVTGFQRFGMQVISHLLTHTSWLEKIHNGIISIPSYMDILTAIFDAIPSVIDYSEVLNGIKAGILGIAIPNVLDYSEVLEGIKAGILGIAIPNIIDYTDVLNGIKTGILSGLSDLFIPDISPITDLKPQFEDKFSFVPQIEEIWNNFLNGNFGGNRPDFKITIPASFLHSDSDKECIIIDFSLFDQYRSILHDIIILLAYLAFGRRLLVSLPSLLGYSSGSSGHAVIINNNTVRNSYNRYDYMGD